MHYDLNSIFDRSLDLLLIFDLEGRIKKINKTCTTLLGFTEEEIINKNRSLIHPEDFPAVFRLFKELSDGAEVTDLEIRVSKKNGKYIWTKWSIVPDIQKSIIFAVGRNITTQKHYEDQLRSSDAELRAIFAAINDLIIILDREGVYKKIAPTHPQLLFKPAKELIGKKLHDVFDKKIADDFLKLIHKALDTGETIKSRYKMTVSSGEEKWFAVSVSPMLPDSIIWMARDISDSVEAEEAIRASEEKHRTLFETMPQGVVYEDLEKGIISANPAAQKILGVTLEEMQGKTLLDSNYKLIHEDGTEVIDDSNPAMVAIKIGREVKNVVLGVMPGDEEQYRWININAVPLFKKGEDKPYQVNTTFDDITERKRSEQALRESEVRYRQLVELSPNTVGIIKDEKIVFINAAGAELIGAKNPDALIGKKYLDFIHEDHKNEVLKILRQLTRRKKTPLSELKVRKFDQSIIYLEAIAMPFNYKGEEAVQFILRDITERKKVEEERERLFKKISVTQDRLKILSRRLIEAQESERRILSRELHDEVGQTLTAIKIDLQTVKNLSKSEKMKSHLEDSVELVEGALQQIRNLSLDLRPSMIDDLGLISALRWYVDKQSQRSGINAKLSADSIREKLPPEIEITCYRITQEAITNVIRHSEATSIRIELKKENEYLTLNIEDNGKGFDIRKARKKALGGASIGVIGMQERVELVGGEFAIHSFAGKGTKIRAIFPLAISKK